MKGISTFTPACDALLTDGTTVRVRPIEASDAERLTRFFAALSPDSVYLRFFSPRPRLPEAEIRRYSEVDHLRREAFIALLDDEIIGVASFEPEADPTEAEVAFAVNDEWQGRGVGTLLLEHLAARARALGLTRFTASTLPCNRRMLNVFTSSGLQNTKKFDGDVVRIDMPLEQSRRSAEVVAYREHVSERESIRRLLHADSVAVVGASDRPGSVGRALLQNVLESGYAGVVYPVNPGAATVAGRRAYGSVNEIDGDVALALVAVPATHVVDVARDCAAKGVQGLVVVSAGFAETGPEGAAQQRELVAVARRSGMRVIGPNCVGVVNAAPGVALNGTFASVRPAFGPVGVMSQSGAVGIALLEAAARLGLGISTFVSAGNKADVSGNDMLQYWEDDPDTRVALLYLESFGNPRKFARIAKRFSQNKPIVAVKSGRTDAGRKAASSHTAAMASSDAAVDALFRQTGVIRVDTVREMFAVGRVLAHQPLMRGSRVAIVGNSGGPGILAADACSGAGLQLGDLGQESVTALRTLVPPGVPIANPVDLLASAGPATFASAITAIGADDEVDGIVVIFTPTLVADPDEVAAAVAHAAATLDKPVLAAFITAQDGVLTDTASGAQVPRFEAAEDAIRALGRVAEYAAWRTRPTGTVPSLDDIDPARASELVDKVLAGAPGGRWLDSAEAAEILRAYGIPVLAAAIAASGDDAVSAARAVGFPVALKVASGGVVHKTDVGGVALGLADEHAVRSAWRVMRARIGEAFTTAAVQPMAGGGVETIAGAIQDPIFGPLVMFGMGGTAAELLDDRVIRLAPLTTDDAAAMVRSLRASRLLFGYRGSTTVDIDALERVLLRIAQLVENHPEIAELDLNPVVASAGGATAIDAKLRIAPAPAGEPGVRRLSEPRPA